MGNFSRDTFKLTNTMYQQITGEKVKDPKHYVGVRLQQGVPLVDADWNELEDIRKYEQRAFLKWVVGNGVPQDSDGFRITNATVNDFTINNGVCYVNGWEVINIVNTQYTKQDLFNKNDLAAKWGVDPLPLLQMKPGQYTVYLDVWERQVDKQEDGRIVNDIIGIETCVRFKREWVVRVAEGDQAPAAKPDHVHYKLAILEVKQAPLVSVTVTDLRRTGLAILSKEITIKDGNVGIGITSPQAPLHINQSMAVGPFAIENAQGTLSVTGANAGINIVNRSLTAWPATPAAGDRYVWYNQNGMARLWTDQKGDMLTVTGSGNVIVGTPGPEDKYLFEVAGQMKVRGDKATGTAGIWFSQQYGFNERAFVGLSDDNHIGFKGNTGANWGLIMDTSNGNVGIGTTSPTAKLSVGTTDLRGTAHSTTFKTNAGTLGTNADDELALASIGFLSKNASAFGIRAYRTKKGDDWTTTAIGFGMDVDDTVRASTTPGFSARALWLNANGYVGIGNSAPRETLDVNGRIICRNTRKKIEKNDARTYANNGNWEVVPDMHTTVTVGQNSILIIFKAGVKFKGEVLFNLYVDNQLKANTRIKSDTEDKTDVMLTALEIDKFPGEHDIRVDWLPTTGSTATISDLQMTRQLLIMEL